MMERRKNLNDKFGFVEIMEVSLNEIGEIITGNTPSKSDTNFWNSPDICFIKPDVIAEDEITELLDSNEYISENARNKARIVNENSILVTCIGSIAKIGIVKIRECAFNQQINAIIPNKNIDTKYLCYCLQNSKVKLKAIANAPVVPIINKKQFGEFVVKIDGDISTQKKIVNRLDYIQSVITLYKIQLQKFDDLIKARFVEMFGDPIINPYGFPVKKIDEVAVLNKGITYSPDDISKEGIIVLRSGNIKGNAFDLEDIVRISKKISNDKLVNENDILMCNRNGSVNLVGKVAKIPKLEEKMTFGTFMTIVRSEIFEYLFVFFQMNAFREQIKFQTAVAINQISLPLLASVKVPIPTNELIKEFADFVEQVDKSRFDIKKSITELEREVVYD